ncbi:MAG: hypothetical protein RI886_1295 [Pseudomonadota bacterium]
MGKKINKVIVSGEVADIETLSRLRPWMEDEAKKKKGSFGKTSLITDYDARRNVYRFKIYV